MNIKISWSKAERRLFAELATGLILKILKKIVWVYYTPRLYRVEIAAVMLRIKSFLFHKNIL